MLKKELILQNPLRFLENETGDILLEGGYSLLAQTMGPGKAGNITKETAGKAHYRPHADLLP